MKNRPTREEAQQAVRTLIAWAGDDPDRKELLDTPKRVVKSYEEFFKGYTSSIDSKIDKTFNAPNNYSEMIILRDIDFISHCEHHMLPMIGQATVAYVPNKKIIGLSKLARIVEIFSKRLQIQERLVVEITECLDKIVEPKGVGVMIEASHQCLALRGACKPNTIMKTSHLLGCFKENSVRAEFLNIK
ncbi:MAG: GTP cyclohydrolase I FolE [Pseudomonadota bacterium]